MRKYTKIKSGFLGRNLDEEFKVYIIGLWSRTLALLDLASCD